MSYVLYVNGSDVVVIPADREDELVETYEQKWGYNLSEDYDRHEADEDGDVISFRAKVN